jgi:hypothetical protein
MLTVFYIFSLFHLKVVLFLAVQLTLSFSIALPPSSPSYIETIDILLDRRGSLADPALLESGSSP